MKMSAKHLTAAHETAILEQLYTILADFHQASEVKDFLTSIMTPTERLVFAKRLAIAWQLEQDKSYEEIARHLNVSSSTISSVADMKSNSGLRMALEKLLFDLWFTNLCKKLRFWKR